MGAAEKGGAGGRAERDFVVGRLRGGAEQEDGAGEKSREEDMWRAGRRVLRTIFVVGWERTVCLVVLMCSKLDVLLKRLCVVTSAEGVFTDAETRYEGMCSTSLVKEQDQQGEPCVQVPDDSVLALPSVLASLLGGPSAGHSTSSPWNGVKSSRR